ncbi:AMP binding protein [Cantharellus anzutake]|uniref:AMP binding protein n=1 Tax=Cantharellus anzutake TaxID=1750568 RepID=UPI001905093C|nr:AMP binding protein [Cantharellus anzutake]KAF8338754.1 AMP binding protein [Cantharellus anzutake]
MLESTTHSEPIIYKSFFPSLKLEFSGLFSHLFRNKESLDDSPAYIDAISGITLTRAQVHDQSLRLACGVRKHGLKRDDVAMIFSPNSLAWPIVLLGSIAAGVKATLANTSYTTSELAHQIRDSNTRLVFVHPTLLSTLEKTLNHLRIPAHEIRKKVVIMSYTPQDEVDEKEAGIGKEWARLKDFLSVGKLVGEERFDGSDSLSTVLLCYSSGTTGLSKGVETTHRNILTVLQIFKPAFYDYDAKKDVSGAVLPFYHIYGVVQLLFFAIHTGIPTVIMPRFEPELFLSTTQRYRITILKIVPPIILFMNTHPMVDNYDLSSIRYVMSAAAPLGAGPSNNLIARLKAKGCNEIVLTQAFGLTETSPATHLVPPKWSTKKIGSCGALLPNLEARLVDDDGNDVIKPSAGGASAMDPENDGRGELWIRGPSVMKGYLHNPAATANSITRDGWFKTGDVAIRDEDGFYYIVDRKKELIKYKGSQVPPAELEAVLLTKEDILDVGVVGIQSVHEGEELPRAYVVSKRNGELLKDKSAQKAYELEVQEWIKSRVAKHKWLRGGVVVIEAVPKSAAGKILRRHLRDLARKETEQIRGKL